MARRTANFISGDAAFAVDREGEIVSWNQGAEKVFQLPASTAVGERCWKLMCGKDSFGNRYCSERCPIMGMALQHESVHSFQAQFKTASDGYKKFTINCLVLFGKPGDELILHICQTTEEKPEPAANRRSNAASLPTSQKGALTSREIEVLAHLAEGKTTREIASSLWISQATVRNHVNHTLRKLRVHNRLEAVVVGQRLNLV